MSAEVEFRSLFPGRQPALSAAAYVAGLAAQRELRDDRALVLVNFVATLDGNATFDGRSAPLSDRGDRVMFHALRDGADAIMSGTGTLAIERYRPLAKPVVTVTRSGQLPVAIKLFAEPDGRVIVFSGRPTELTGARADVSVEPLHSLAAALATLRHRYGIAVLLCEGGPSLFGALAREGLVDELFLTLAPKLAGGSAGPGLTSGLPAPELLSLSLASVLEREGTLFLRYTRPHGSAGSLPANG